jgi:photosystem II stability/assembly factor-like uncharacterized protein
MNILRLPSPLSSSARAALLFVASWALICTGAVPLPAQTFQPLGPTGGDVRSLAADPSHPGTVYLGTTDGDVFASRDAGEHWARLGRTGDDPTAVVSGLLVDEKDGSTLFATTWTRGRGGESGAVYISHDAGRSFQLAGLTGHALRAVAQAPSDPNVLVAGGLDGVFLTRDHAITWKRITPDDYAELRNVDSLAFDPADAATIYVGTFHLPWKTKDSGEHWLAIHDGMIDDSDVLSLAVDAQKPDTIFASACSGIYSSDTAGAQWKKIAGIPYSSRRTYALKQDPRTPADLYAGTNEGLYISKDGGDSWNRTTAADWTINAIAIVSEREGSRGGDAPHRRVIVGTEQQGVLVSDDGGAHLRRSNDGFVHQRVVSIATSGARSVAILTEDSDLPAQISDDGGYAWKVMGNNADAMGIAEIVTTPDGWRATLSGGGLARFNRGANAWARTGTVAGGGYFGSKIQELAFSDTAWYAATEDGLFSSSNEGITWTKIPIGPAEFPVRSVQTNQSGNAIWIAASRGMVSSEDGGKNWTWHDLDLQAGGVLRVVWADDTIFALSPGGVFASRDGGRNWIKLEHGLPGAQASDASITTTRWLISMKAGGVFESRDRGDSWRRLATREAAVDGSGDQFPVITAATDGSHVYAGTANDSVVLIDFGGAR